MDFDTFLKKDILLGIGTTSLILDLGWHGFYHGLLRKVTSRDVPAVKKYIRTGCFLRALQEFFNTAVMFAMVDLFSLGMLVNNMGFAGQLIENLTLAFLAMNNISVPVAVLPLGKLANNGIFYS